MDDRTIWIFPVFCFMFYFSIFNFIFYYLTSSLQSSVNLGFATGSVCQF